MQKIFVLIAFVLYLFPACKKKSGQDLIDPFACKYFPLSEGSKWVYKGKENALDFNTTHSSSNVSAAQNSVSATYTRGANPPEQVYCANGEVRGTTSNAITGTVTAAILREFALQDSIWQYNYIFHSIPVKIEFKVISKGNSRTVNGQTYDDVIEMNESLYVDPGTGFTLVRSSFTSYAAHVGIVESVQDSMNYIQLTSYNIVQ